MQCIRVHTAQFTYIPNQIHLIFFSLLLFCVIFNNLFFIRSFSRYFISVHILCNPTECMI